MSKSRAVGSAEPGRHPEGCSEIVALLADYLEDRLPSTTQRRLDRHLHACPRCVAYLKTYRATVSLLRDLHDDDLPDELRRAARRSLGPQPE